MTAAPKRINKFIFLQSTACLTRGWFLRRGEGGDERTEAENLRADEGREIGRRARDQFPGGVLVAQQDPVAAAATTRALLADPGVAVIFEPAFIVGPFIARPDILRRTASGWDMIEVKSSLEPKVPGSEPEGDLYEDVAYTLMVARRAGLAVSRCALLLLRRDFRLGTPDSALFREIECTAAVDAIARAFDGVADGIAASTGAAEPPPARLIRACKECEFFAERCVGRDLRNPLFELPRFVDPKFSELVARGVLTIDQVPDGFPISETQGVVRTAVKTGTPQFDRDALRGALGVVRWPAWYLDFETVKTALPLYPEVAPHEQIPTQFSIHLCDRPGNVVGHNEYLADPATDCRATLAEQLVQDLAGEGTIIAHHASFEKGVLKGLAARFPDHAAALTAGADRVFDLENAVKPGAYYHPGFRGSSSIKNVLPVLAPEVSYQGLEVADGDTALAMFARLARRDPIDRTEAQVRAALLAYCNTDTLAMVRVHERLCRECGLA